MIAENLIKKGIGSETDFRWRGREVTRIEGFSDAVFAFAITLIVVTLEVPKTFTQLLETMRGFLAFGTSFAILIWIWYAHYKFFRRYGLSDLFTITMNAILLFVVLFYVFPLKFVFTFVINGFLFPESIVRYEVAPSQTGSLMMIYGTGFFLIFMIFGILHWHAYKLRDQLELSVIEVFITKSALQSDALLMGIAVLSVVFACSDNPVISGFLAGITYGLIGPVLSFHGWRRGKQFTKLKKQMQ
jgi:uncharacterized membrane protein